MGNIERYEEKEEKNYCWENFNKNIPHWLIKFIAFVSDNTSSSGSRSIL